MAIFIPGMRCVLSGKRIDSPSEAVMFPPFVSNEADPLYVFSDAVIHASAFRNHPLASRAQERYDAFRRSTAPQNLRCFICGNLIRDVDDYLGLGFLVEDEHHPLHAFNYAHFHRSHLRRWSDLHPLIDDLQGLETSGTWKGESLRNTLEELNALADVGTDETNLTAK